jgi:heat shock protein 4
MIGFDQSRHMGDAAQSLATSNYKNTITNMKRLVGLAFDDPRAQAEMKYCSFKCVPMKRALGGPDGIGVEVMLNGEQHTVPIEAVAGMMLKYLGMIAANKQAETSQHAGEVNSKEQLFPQDWVIAVPAYFTDAQRRGFLVGCEICGITGVQRLMNEHTAVALSYGIFKDLKKEFDKEKPTNVMFIDIGASCYTVSIVAFETGKLVVKSVYYDESVGGRNFDELIAQFIADKFEEK